MEKQINSLLSEDDIKLLKAIAKKENRSFRRHIRYVLEKHIHEYYKPQNNNSNTNLTMPKNIPKF